MQLADKVAGEVGTGAEELARTRRCTCRTGGRAGGQDRAPSVFVVASDAASFGQRSRHGAEEVLKNLKREMRSARIAGQIEDQSPCPPA